MIDNHLVIGNWDAPGCDREEVARCLTCKELPPVAGADECEYCLIAFYRAFPDEIDQFYPAGETWDRIKIKSQERVT